MEYHLCNTAFPPTFHDYVSTNQKPELHKQELVIVYLIKLEALL